MPFEYSCFISYPHGQDNVLRPFVDDFKEGLTTEVYAQIRKQIWIDRKDLSGGDLLDEAVAHELCKSVCMIGFYTPLYFDIGHLYCAKEFRAMEILEERRLAMLKLKADRKHGLIIPVILRGPKRFPTAIRTKRLCYEFDDIDLNDPAVKIRARHASEIRRIAEYVIECCDRFDTLTEDPCNGCDDFAFPSEKDVVQYVETLLGKPISIPAVPFPGH